MQWDCPPGAPCWSPTQLLLYLNAGATALSPLSSAGPWSLPLPLSLSPSLQAQSIAYEVVSELQAQQEELEARLAALESRLDALGASLQALPNLIAQAICPLPPPWPGPGHPVPAAQSTGGYWLPATGSDCG